MSKYEYVLHRCVYINVVIEADDEDSAQEAYERMCENGELNDRWRDEVLETDEEVAEVWDGGIEDGICIYKIY